jgi:hypothetical protein
MFSWLKEELYNVQPQLCVHDISMRSQTFSFLAQVPFRLLKKFHNVQQRLVRELEKKFQGRDVVIIGNRRIMPPPKTGYALARPRSRTLSAVRFYLFTYIAGLSSTHTNAS